MDPVVHLARREYIIPCNWKVFADNYLDGGYHVPHAHPDLAGGNVATPDSFKQQWCFCSSRWSVVA
jgi:phenylpropionate dioxygenase-like ring-hydroxylating dioxygenase large terminal subunit